LPVATNAQCNSKLVIFLSNQKQSQVTIIKKNHPVEVITRYQTFSGRLSCIHPDMMEVGDAPIPLEDVEVIISKRKKFKVQDVAAVPMIYMGYGLGIAGSILTAAAFDWDDDENADVAPLVGGLAALAGSAVFLYYGYQLKSGNVPQENPVYGLGEWKATILPLNSARKSRLSFKKKSH
jgi:hypothetical protein